jgi:hypothetical protein
MLMIRLGARNMAVTITGSAYRRVVLCNLRCASGPGQGPTVPAILRVWRRWWERAAKESFPANLAATSSDPQHL